MHNANNATSAQLTAMFETLFSFMLAGTLSNSGAESAIAMNKKIHVLNVM